MRLFNAGIFAVAASALPALIKTETRQSSLVARNESLKNKCMPERTYPNSAWTDPETVRETNCDAYGRNNPCLRGIYTQPGGASGNQMMVVTCENFLSTVKKDGYISPIKEDGVKSVCPTGYYLNYLVVAPPEHISPEMNYPNGDFHFLREDLFQQINNITQKGGWSQKPGFGSPPTNLDGLQNVITDPSKANHNHAYYQPTSLTPKWINYTEHCGFSCVPEITVTKNGNSLSNGQIAGIATGASVAGLIGLAGIIHKVFPNNPISKVITGFYGATPAINQAVIV